MFKKVLLVCSVLFGLMFYGMAGECFAQPYFEGNNLEKADQLYEYVTGMWPADEIWLQMYEALRNIARGKMEAAQATVDKLLADFSKNQYLPVALHEIGKLYGHFKKYQEGVQLHQYVIDNWPGHEYAMWSLREVARQNIELGNIEAAQAALDKVLARFSSNKYAALIVYEVAEHHRKFKNYEKAEQLYKYALNTWPENWRVVLSQSGLARLYIDMGNETATDAALAKLLADFSATGGIDWAVYEIAKECRESEKYEKAKQHYQQVVDNWPGEFFAMWSQSGLALCNIALGNMEAAQSATDRLIANYHLAYRIDEGVYDIAHQYNKFGKYEQAKQAYQYVIDHWPETKDAMWSQIGLAQANMGLGNNATAEAIIDGLVTKLNADFPSGSELLAKAVEGYYYAGDCYRKLGEYEKSIDCYQRVADDSPDYEYAWNALFLVGRNYESLKKSGIISKSEADTKIKAAYQELLEKYPDCTAAKPARQWLSRQIGTK